MRRRVLCTDILDARVRKGNHECQSEGHSKDYAIVDYALSEHLRPDRFEGDLVLVRWECPRNNKHDDGCIVLEWYPGRGWRNLVTEGCLRVS